MNRSAVQLLLVSRLQLPYLFTKAFLIVQGYNLQLLLILFQ